MMNTEQNEFVTFLNEVSEDYFIEYSHLFRKEIEEIMAAFFPLHNVYPDDKIMIFVDGENLAIRYGHEIEERGIDVPKHVFYEPNIYVWSVGLNNLCVSHRVLRKYYYTSLIPETHDAITTCIDTLKAHNIEDPKVFKRTKNRHSKGVDISLATDMLTHAFRGNYAIAILVAGDGDYVPLVEAVRAEGCRVFLWFFEKGLSKDLRRSVDWFTDIGDILFSAQFKSTQR